VRAGRSPSGAGRAAVAVALELELEPGLAGQPHLGVQQQATALAVGDQHAPEVERVAGAQFGGVAAAAAQAGAAHQAVEEPAEPPEPLGVVPAVGAADAPQAVDHLVGRVVQRRAAGVVVGALGRHLHQPVELERAAAGDDGVRPRRDDGLLLDLLEGEPDGLVVGDGVERDDVADALVARDHVDRHGVDQVARQR
jgi:hypothetical protein